MAALVASPTPQWHAVVCCDDDHGSSSKPRQGATMTDTASLSSSAPSSFTDSSTSSGSMEKQKKCPSPCPFETYCCLDEHCAPDCAAAARAAECKADNCAEACFDPTCDDGCEAECCDDPECEPEWCPEGCTIEEYLACCAAVCNDADALGLLPPGSAPLPTPPYLDLISAALAGQIAPQPHITPQPPPVVAPPPPPAVAGNVCHWQNCHRTFETMPLLLAHLASDHLGAGAFESPAPNVPRQPTPAVMPELQTMTAVTSPHTPFSVGFNGNMLGSTPTTTPAAQGDLFSCLWDDCFPLESFEPIESTVIQAPQQTHTHPQHTHTHTHAETGESLTPQTMLRHLLEEHLGIAPALIDPFQPVHDHRHDHHGHDHSGHAAHDHVHAHDGHEHTHPHGHAHNHPHAHTPRPKPYARPVSVARTTASHAHDHPHGHSHTHKTNGHTPAHHHHVKFPLSPSPTPSSSEPAQHFCRWPGCTHGAPFATTGDLMEHLSEEHVGRGKDQYRCLWDGCGGEQGRVFRSRQKVLRHLQSHTGHRPFICHVCGQGFSEAAPLAAHLRRHSDDKPYVCDVPGCGKAFAISSSLTIHKRTHNGDKPFVCPYCSKGFVEASNLTKHIRTHTGERPFACTHPGCGRAFSRPDQLKRHMLVHTNAKKKEAAIKGET